MKIYNPFKQHIRQCSNGKFGIARLASFGFEFKDKVDDTWWSNNYLICKHCLATDPKDLKVPVPKVKLTHKYYRIE